MRRNVAILMGGTLSIALLILALWCWQRDEDLAIRLGAHNLKIAIWAVRCAAVALVAAAEAVLALIVVPVVYKRDTITGILGLLAVLVFMFSTASAVALGLAGR